MDRAGCLAELRDLRDYFRRALQPSAKTPTRQLNDTEQRILRHCRRKAHKGERIAHWLGLSYDHVRRVLARLVNNELLRKTDSGYRTVQRAT
jgi:hypothetical protein